MFNVMDKFTLEVLSWVMGGAQYKLAILDVTWSGNPISAHKHFHLPVGGSVKHTTLIT